MYMQRIHRRDDMFIEVTEEDGKKMLVNLAGVAVIRPCGIGVQVCYRAQPWVDTYTESYNEVKELIQQAMNRGD
jgi:hypothetical protein